ncbi:hypothetical protein N9R81_02740 [Flavobacteriales bacterium]|nr:hypothetical protein [Flavobacteriales bacterium]
MNRDDQKIKGMLSGKFPAEQAPINFTSKVMCAVKADTADHPVRINQQPLISIKGWGAAAIAMFFICWIAFLNYDSEMSSLYSRYSSIFKFNLSISPILSMGAISIFILLNVNRFIQQNRVT